MKGDLRRLRISFNLLRDARVIESRRDLSMKFILMNRLS
jgi:hypothetical protein